MTTSESKGRFFYKTNRFESIRITNRIESIRIANWNALVSTAASAVLRVSRNSALVYTTTTTTTWGLWLQQPAMHLLRNHSLNTHELAPGAVTLYAYMYKCNLIDLWQPRAGLPSLQIHVRTVHTYMHRPTQKHKITLGLLKIEKLINANGKRNFCRRVG